MLETSKTATKQAVNTMQEKKQLEEKGSEQIDRKVVNKKTNMQIPIMITNNEARMQALTEESKNTCL